MSTASIAYPSEVNGRVFDDALFRDNNVITPSRSSMVCILREITDMDISNAMVLIEGMLTNTMYPIEVINNAYLLRTLENMGFTIEI